jgi:hypothetical protein
VRWGGCGGFQLGPAGRGARRNWRGLRGGSERFWHPTGPIGVTYPKFPNHPNPVESLNAKTDFDLPGGGPVWYAHPRLFFICNLSPKKHGVRGARPRTFATMAGRAGTTMDASQCGNDRPRFGLPAVTPETAGYNIIRV